MSSRHMLELAVGTMGDKKRWRTLALVAAVRAQGSLATRSTAAAEQAKSCTAPGQSPSRPHHASTAVATAFLLAMTLGLLPSCSFVSRNSWDEFVQHNEQREESRLNSVSHGDGTPVILLHGLGANGYTWRHLISAAPAGYQFIVFDLRGFGESPKPGDDKYSLYDQANLIYDFILEKDLRDVTLIGHSMGGGIALLVALKLRETSQSRLSALVLLDSVAYPQRIPAFIRLLQTPVLGPLAVRLLPADFQVRTILRLAYLDDRKISEDVIDAYAAPLRAPGSAHALVESARQMMPRDLSAVSGRYGRIDVPTLLVWCREDTIVPLDVGEKLHAAIPSSKLVTMEGCGHFPHEEKPEVVVPLIMRFLVEIED